MQDVVTYCDDCHAECVAEVWLDIEGGERCRDCALAKQQLAVKATRPEARDDGR